jgi:tetraacyldisaccharide 4'-kinase
MNYPRGVMVRMASGIWSSLSLVSRTLSRKGVLESTQLTSRVISVGNIQAGGTGKTPLVANIAHEAIRRGNQVCILTRGYKSTWESEGGVILPREENLDTRLCGDEAALLHDLCPEAYIGVGADRVQQYERVSEKSKSPIDLVILDDGFQHWKIKKDLEIVVLTSKQPSDALFRDFYHSIRHADLLVWTKGDSRPLCGGTPLIVVKYRLQPPSNSQPVWLVTGVGDPDFVYQLACESGYSVVRHIRFEDHARYDLGILNRILENAQREGAYLITTGKDWVKWRTLGFPHSRVHVIEPELDFVEGKEQWSRMLWGK